MAKNVSVWLSAIRPRTLSLSTTAIVVGSGLASMNGFFNLPVLCLAMLTAVLLQILSNLANDYGDEASGIDTKVRVRSNVIASGMISKESIFAGIIIILAASIVCGLLLLIISTWGNPAKLFIFIGLGGASIVAAVTYTVGKYPYGYMGLGDLSVLIFFGYLAVLGTYLLSNAPFSYDILLPATSTGFIAVAVLNVNNIRDMESDRKAGKRTIPLMLGARGARYYHWSLILLSLLLWSIFLYINNKSFLWLVLMVAGIPLLWSAWQVWRHDDLKYLNRQVMITVLSGAFLNITMAVSLS